VSLAISTTSPSRHRPRADVHEVVQELRRLNPRMGEERLAEALAERIEEDRRLLLDASRVLVRQALTTETIVRRRRRQDGRTPEERSQRRIAAKAEVKKLVEKVREVAVLDMVVDGKALRFLTGAEVARLGAGFSKLAERVPADALVGEIVTEAEAAELMQAAV
jgi:hypothetical protein